MENLGVVAFVFGLAGLSFAIMALGFASKIDEKVNKLVKRIEELEKKWRNKFIRDGYPWKIEPRWALSDELSAQFDILSIVFTLASTPMEKCPVVFLSWNNCV